VTTTRRWPTPQTGTLDELAVFIRNSAAPTREALPLIKLAVFGDIKTHAGSLRHDKNVQSIDGVEGDYDGGVMSLDEAAAIADKVGLFALFYASPSSTPEKPRWRILAPSSKPLPPEERDHLMGRLNGLYHGIFDAASWALSQSYFAGRVDGRPIPQIEIVGEKTIDQIDELDDAWVGKPSAHGNGVAFTNGPLDVDGELAALIAGERFHGPCMRVIGKWAQSGVGMLEAQERIVKTFEGVFPPDRDARWHDRRFKDLPRCLDYIYGKEGDKLGEEVTFTIGSARTATQDTESAHTSTIGDAADLFDEAIPPRGWVLGTVFCKQFVSALVGTGPTGRTALRIVQALSVATGRGLTDEFVHRRAKVLFLCFEDSLPEPKRRIRAAMRHHGVQPDEVRGRFFYETVSGAKMLKAGPHGTRIPGQLESLLRRIITDLGVELVIFDPFVKIHGLSENDNSGIDEVVTILAQLGMDLDVALDYLHHTRKGANEPGDADIGRGASAAKDAARLGYTLTTMTAQEGESFGITDPALRRSLIRMDSAKVNIAPPSGDATWFRLVPVELGNATADYPHGDTVQTVERWYPPDTWRTVTIAAANRILDLIDKGPAEGRRYSHAAQSKDRKAWPVVQEICPELNEKQAKVVIATWLKNEVLRIDDYTDPVDSKECKGLYVGKQPGNNWER
jgi:AAA domain